jgi:RNA polymerase sigma factor (sigma-70 family)
MQEEPIDLRALKEDDADAWTKAWPTLQSIAFKAAWRVLRDEHEAEDVACESVVRLRQNLHAIHTTDHLRSYLLKTARHTSLSVINNMHATKRDCDSTVSLEECTVGSWELRVPPAQIPPPGSLSDKADLIRDLASLLELLGNPCRFLLAEHFWQGVRPIDLASELDLPAPTVRMQIFRCLNKLRAILKANSAMMKRLNEHLC